MMPHGTKKYKIARKLWAYLGLSRFKKSLVLGNLIFGLKTGVGYLSFQTITLFILLDLLLVYADCHIVFNLKEFDLSLSHRMKRRRCATL